MCLIQEEVLKRDKISLNSTQQPDLGMEEPSFHPGGDEMLDLGNEMLDLGTSQAKMQSPRG